MNRECLICKKDISKKRIDAVFCSEKCMSKNFYNKNKEKRNQENTNRYKNKKYLIIKSRELRYCKLCNKEINKEKRIGTKYCSNKCALKDYREIYKATRRQKEKRKHDYLFLIKEKIRKRIRKILKQKKIIKINDTKEILGCSFEFARNYLESKFKNGMTWNNHGKWHIDHIIPLASAKTEKEIYRLCHYTNLQPLWAKDNLSKGAKIIAR